MPIIRRQLKPSDVYPDNLRYNEATGTVQSLVNGVWMDNPAADPRTQTTLPPRITADPACDAAESVKNALKGQIDDIILAIDNASTAFTIAGLILGLLAFGPFGIFIGIALAIADAMIASGSAAIEGALTEPVYEQFKCIMFCQFNSSGRLKTGGLAKIEADVNSQIGGLGATILNSMLELAGTGGINNLASLGTATGDCSECDFCDETCDSADTFIIGTVNSITENEDGTTTFNITSGVEGAGTTQHILWGDRFNASSPCCTFVSQDAFDGTALGGAIQACGSATEDPVPPIGGYCLHFYLFYGNDALTTPFTCNVTMGHGC